MTIDGVTRPGAPVPGRGHPEPDRVRGHLPAARGPARPVPDAAAVGYLSAEAEWRMLERRLERTATRSSWTRSRPWPTCWRCSGPSRRCTWPRAWAATSSSWSPRPGPARGSRSGCPRGSLALLKVARARAALAGRDFVTPEDVKAVAVPTLAHRLLLRPELWVLSAPRTWSPSCSSRSRPRPRGRAGRRPDPRPGRPVTRRPSAKIAAYTGVAALALLAGLALGRPELVAVAARWPCWWWPAWPAPATRSWTPRSSSTGNAALVDDEVTVELSLARRRPGRAAGGAAGRPPRHGGPDRAT